MDEQDFIAALRAIAPHPAARGLADDAAVLALADAADLVVTHDMMAAGVHWLPSADPADVAWKLLATNLSDLAAKGAVPLGVVLGYTLSGAASWDRAFVAGLGAALSHFDTWLLGGDTVRVADNGTGRTIGMTALGRASHQPVPGRSGAQPGDALWLVGTVGDAGAGLDLLAAGRDGAARLLTAHRRPVPLLAAGRALAPMVRAMLDVSDGLLIDAARLAAASNCGVAIDLAALPLSAEFRAARGHDLAARLFAATAGDDYALLAALPADCAPPCLPGVSLVRIGACRAGAGVMLHDNGTAVPLPGRLGYVHAAAPGPHAERGSDKTNSRR